AVAWAQSRGLIASDVGPELFLPRYEQLRSASRYVATLPERSLSAPLHAFWSEHTRTRRGAQLPDWSRYTRGEASEHVVPGDHEAVLCDATVLATVAALLR
ncbi:MAG TPA: hypothetical protein VFX59_19680, partial [Polyangiales bacterium]|nr:hypothetical protein [Polyangiales bacterium]